MPYTSTSRHHCSTAAGGPICSTLLNRDQNVIKGPWPNSNELSPTFYHKELIFHKIKHLSKAKRSLLVNNILGPINRCVQKINHWICMLYSSEGKWAATVPKARYKTIGLPKPKAIFGAKVDVRKLNQWQGKQQNCNKISKIEQTKNLRCLKECRRAISDTVLSRKNSEFKLHNITFPWGKFDPFSNMTLHGGTTLTSTPAFTLWSVEGNIVRAMEPIIYKCQVWNLQLK